MREILFRAKRIDNEEWVEGVALPHDNNGAVTMFRQNQGDGALEGFEVVPDTVGQYTGSTDKKGKKIFEGDIVKCKYYFRELSGYIKWGNHGNVCVIGIIKPMNSLLNKIFVDCEDFEIIGNIHDNPELLKNFKKRKENN